MKTPKDKTPKRLSMNEKDAKQKKRDAFIKIKKSKENAARLKNSNGFKDIQAFFQGFSRKSIESLKGKFEKLHEKLEDKINQTAKMSDDLDDFGSDTDRSKYVKTYWAKMEDKIVRDWKKEEEKLKKSTSKIERVDSGFLE